MSTLSASFKERRISSVYTHLLVKCLPDCELYDEYFEEPRPSNKQLYRILFGPFIAKIRRTFSSKTENTIDTINKESNNENNGNPDKSKLYSLPKIETDEKVLISGDDILIYYISRIVLELKTWGESNLKPSWKRSIEKFITHNVWYSPESISYSKMSLSLRLEHRLFEMKERKKKIARSVFQSNMDFEEEYKETEIKKSNIISTFSALQLENMLRNATKNVAHEVISCLIEKTTGILSRIVSSRMGSKNRKKESAQSIAKKKTEDDCSCDSYDSKLKDKLHEARKESLCGKSKDAINKRMLCHTPTNKNECSSIEDSVVMDGVKEYRMTGIAKLRGLGYHERPHITAASHTFYRPSSSLSPYKFRRKV